MILHALAETGTPPDRAVFIDDSPTGCRAGIAAGVRTLGFAEETDPDRLRDVGAEIMHSMQDVRAALSL